MDNFKNLPASPINSGAYEFAKELYKEAKDATGYAPQFIDSISFLSPKYRDLSMKMCHGAWSEMAFFDVMMNGWGEELYDLLHNDEPVPEIMSAMGYDEKTNWNWVRDSHIRVFLRAKNPKGASSVEDFKNDWRTQVEKWIEAERTEKEERKRKREQAKLYKTIRLLKTDVALLKDIIMETDVCSYDERERLLEILED